MSFAHVHAIEGEVRGTLPQNIKRKTTGKEIVGHIAEKLDLEALLMQNPPDFESFIDHWYHVLNLLVELPIKSRDNIDSKGFVCINSEAVNNHIKQGSKILQYMIDNDILLRSPYKPEEKSRGYKYTSNYHGRYKEVKYRNNPYKPRKKKNALNYHPLIKPLEKFNSLIEFDLTNALQWIEQQPEKYINKKGKKCTFDKYLEQIVVCNFAKGQFAKCSFPDDFGDRRLYPQWAICRESYRYFLKFQGESFSALDFSGSQLFMSRVLFYPGFYSSISVGGKVCYGNLSLKVKKHCPETISEFVTKNNSNHTTPQPYTYTTSTASSYMFGKSSTTAMNIDIQKYIQLVDNNEFYPFMISELRKEKESLVSH